MRAPFTDAYSVFALAASLAQVVCETTSKDRTRIFADHLMFALQWHLR
jgi:hypothetical protein